MQDTKVDYGEITLETPIGRRFEIETEQGGSYTMTLVSFDGSAVRAVNSNDGDGDVQEITIEDWRDNFAPQCAGFTDPPETCRPVGEDEPAAAPGPVDPKLIADLYDAAEDRREAEIAYASAAEIAKARKKDLEAAQERENRIVDKITGAPGAMPLFDDKPTDDATAGEVTPDDNTWKQVPLANLHDPAISERYLKAMAEHEPPLLTLGDLTDWQKDKGDFWAADISGIGEAAQGEIADATAAFWERRQQAQAQQEASMEEQAATDG